MLHDNVIDNEDRTGRLASGATVGTRFPRRVGSALFAIVAVFLVLTSAGCSTGDQSAAAVPPVPPPAPGLTLKFHDYFSGGSLNRRLWSTCYPWYHPCNQGTNVGNQELEWYLPGQVKVTGGELQLRAARTPTKGRTASGARTVYPWRSGMVTTFRSFKFTYGYVEVRAQVPAGQGFWPALWLLPVDFSWPPEIDIMEVHGGNPSVVQLTNIPTVATKVHTLHKTVDLSKSFHTYGMDWEPQGITWYLDGKKLFSTSVNIPNQPMYLLANLAIDGKPGDSPTATTPDNGTFAIDSIEIWQRTPSS